MKKMIMGILIINIILSITIPVLAEFDRGEFYPLLTVVFKTEDNNDYRIINCIDKSHNKWTFYDKEYEWERGDIANLLMWRMDDDYTNDKIVEVYWEGYVEDLNIFFKINGWR